ncbi:MAG: calcium/proton exchanger [Chloroflexi bacterium]|nr:calcium/proton exchanger [Chloroflexota bacterium]
MNWLQVLLIGAPLAIVGELLHWPPIAIFGFACAALIPLAGWIGESTEMLAERTGPKIGGLLNATFGNAAELIITIAAIREGLLELVKASLTGSILGNLLLVLGASMLFGGLKNGRQKFDRARAGQNSTMLLMVLIALAVPTLFSPAIGPDSSQPVEALSLGVATCMILIYGLGIFYSFRAPATEDTPLTRPSAEHGVKHLWSPQKSLAVMAATVAAVVVLSELLVGTVEPIIEEFPFITEFFLGIILIPIIGNVAEHLVAVQVAMKNQMDLSVEIAVGSSLQIALFVAPALVFVSLLFPAPYLTLHFNQFELIAMMAASVIVALVSADGETNWLEGAQLLVVYVMLGLAFFFLPA